MSSLQCSSPQWQLSFPYAGLIGPDSIKYFFGNHEGPWGAITTVGSLMVLNRATSGIKLQVLNNSHGIQISHIAIAQNCRVCVVLESTDGPPYIEVIEFRSWANVIAWYDVHTVSMVEQFERPITHPKLPGHAVDMKAGANAFVLLIDSGDVFTWGDSRYPKSLARVSSTDPPSNKPSIVEHLAGIPISKIQASGWLFGALSHEKDLYLWGSDRPGTTEQISYLPSDEDGDVKLVEHSVAENVADFAIGSGHIVLNGDEGIYGVGENHNGQLGLGQEIQGVPEWTKLNIPMKFDCIELVCGPHSTLITAQNPN